MSRFLKLFVLPFLLVSLTYSCVVQKSPVSGQKRAYAYSWEEEIEIGEEADRQIRQHYGVYNNEELLNYVEAVGEKVLSVSHLRREDADPLYRNTEFHFRVLNSEVVNAFALPGGYVYVTRGLLSHLNNEAQLAVVLGHEIGHVAARHTSQRVLEQNIGQIALIGGAVAGRELLGLPGQSILNLGGTAAQLMFLQYSRDDERESDRLGVEYAAMQHYRAAEGADFFTTLKRISDQSGQSIPSFLSTHPEPGEREKTIPELAEQWKEKGFAQTRINKQAYLNAIDGMIYGKNPREGFVRDQIFYHPDMEFQFPYPTGWQLSNQKSRVVVSNEKGDAVMLMQTDLESETPQASVRAFVNQEGINVLDQSSTESNGLPAHEATATAETEDGTELGLYIYSLKYRGHIYRYICYTTEDQFENYRPEFERTTSEFDRLTDSDILSIQPVRLRVVQTERSGTFSSFLPEKQPMNISPNEVAIMNQVHLNDRTEKGTYLKLPSEQ